MGNFPAGLTPARVLQTATVASNKPLCRDHFRLTLLVDGFPPTEPGQFVQLLCRSPDDATANGAMLRRPFSLAGRTTSATGDELVIIHRVVGVGTDWLSDLRAGDSVSVLGPLGNVFTLPADAQTAVLVGGGVGIPPMLYLAERLAGRPAVAICGATCGDLLPLTFCDDADFAVEEFAKHGVRSIVTTDDGSLGRQGFVTHALQDWLERHAGAPPMIYTCGPEAMMKAVANLAARFNAPCQVAVERAMACGLGTCQSCCIRVRKPDPQQPPMAGSDWCYRLACTDGPVFSGSELLW